jgi:hypothetical protein
MTLNCSKKRVAVLLYNIKSTRVLVLTIKDTMLRFIGEFS